MDLKNDDMPNDEAIQGFLDELDHLNDEDWDALHNQEWDPGSNHENSEGNEIGCLAFTEHLQQAAEHHGRRG